MTEARRFEGNRELSLAALTLLSKEVLDWGRMLKHL